MVSNATTVAVTKKGDHVIFVGEVERCGVNDAAGDIEPLVFHDARFHTIHTLDHPEA